MLLLGKYIAHNSSFYFRLRGYLSVDVDISELDVNQCDSPETADETADEIVAFHGTHKCHNATTMVSRVKSISHLKIFLA